MSIRSEARADLSAKAWRDAMDAKFFTYMNVTDYVLPLMVARRAGTIVNIVGTGGKIASPMHLPGGAANAALMLASAGLAAAWGHAGVRVNVINPAATMTERLQMSLEVESKMTGKAPEELLRLNEQRIPLRRYAKPEEVADAVLYLTAPGAAFVNGHDLLVDGGFTAR